MDAASSDKRKERPETDVDDAILSLYKTGDQTSDASSLSPPAAEKVSSSTHCYILCPSFIYVLLLLRPLAGDRSFIGLHCVSVTGWSLNRQLPTAAHLRYGADSVRLEPVYHN